MLFLDFCFVSSSVGFFSLFTTYMYLIVRAFFFNWYCMPKIVKFHLLLKSVKVKD